LLSLIAMLPESNGVDNNSDGDCIPIPNCDTETAAKFEPKSSFVVRFEPDSGGAMKTYTGRVTMEPHNLNSALKAYHPPFHLKLLDRENEAHQQRKFYFSEANNYILHHLYHRLVMNLFSL